jgi:hypothetical protein
MKKIILLFISTLLILGSSAQSILFSYVSPVPGSSGINPEQVPILKTGLPFDHNSLTDNLVNISGSKSGLISCKLVLSDDLQTLFIIPDDQFAYGEKIYITLQSGLKSTDGLNISDIHFNFTVREQPQVHRQPEPACCAYTGCKPSPVDNKVNRSVPNITNNHLPFDYPAPTGVFMGNGIAEGYLFFTPSTRLVIQEVDLERNVYFQWRSWDHFEITDATWDISLTSPWIDYVHANALDLDSDGNILVSCRNMDEVTKISYSTGNVIWRLGLNAKNNQFTFLNDPIGFSHQHDIRKLPNGNYTLYDNGNLHIPPVSRALEYNLDQVNMTAMLVWGYQYEPDIYAPVTGNNQRLPNNNRLIGWGGYTPLAMTEVNSSNEIVFGNYYGYNLPKKYLLQVTNQYSQTIQITSSHNHQTSKFYSEDLPVYISPGSSTEISLFFKSNEEGQFKDVLILNFDNEDKTTITIIPDQELDELQRYFIRQKANLLENYTGNLIHYSDSHQYDQKNISINIGHLPAGIYTTLTLYLIDNHSIMKHIVKY